MTQRNLAYTIPAWVAELTPQPKKYLTSILRNVAFAKMKEYERQMQTFEAKHKVSFEAFAKKMAAQTREKFELWDDYIVWKGLHEAYQKWLSRCREL